MAHPRHRAQSMTEYIIIVGLVAIGLMGAVKLFGGQLEGLFGRASHKLSSDTDVTPTSEESPPEAELVPDEDDPTPPPPLTVENPFEWDPAAHNGTGGFKDRNGSYVTAAAIRAAGFDPSELVPMDHPRRAELLQ